MITQSIRPEYRLRICKRIGRRLIQICIFCPDLLKFLKMIRIQRSSIHGYPIHTCYYIYIFFIIVLKIQLALPIDGIIILRENTHAGNPQCSSSREETRDHSHRIAQKHFETIFQTQFHTFPPMQELRFRAAPAVLFETLLQSFCKARYLYLLPAIPRLLLYNSLYHDFVFLSIVFLFIFYFMTY